jgi:peptidoglycan/LPS O-acetylase OafA/YrhL
VTRQQAWGDTAGFTILSGAVLGAALVVGSAWAVLATPFLLLGMASVGELVYRRRHRHPSPWWLRPSPPRGYATVSFVVFMVSMAVLVGLRYVILRLDDLRPAIEAAVLMISMGAAFLMSDVVASGTFRRSRNGGQRDRPCRLRAESGRLRDEGSGGTGSRRRSAGSRSRCPGSVGRRS